METHFQTSVETPLPTFSQTSAIQTSAGALELTKAKMGPGLCSAGVADTWRRSSVARSRVLQPVSSALNEDCDLAIFESHGDASGENRRTARERWEPTVPRNHLGAPTVEKAL